MVFTTYLHFYNLELLTNVWLGFSIVFFLIVFGIFSILEAKKKLGGLITFKEAFSTYFYTILIGNVLNTIYLLALYLIILSPETKDAIKQLMVDSGINVMKLNGEPQEKIEEALKMSRTLNPFTVELVFTGFIKYLLRDCLIGFLVALIFRNKRTL